MVTTREVEYSADDTLMVGHLALPDGTERPAILIAHDGPGLNGYQRRRADRLADLGYVAFALDYHGGGRWIADPDEMMARISELLADPERLRAIGRAGLDVLTAEPRADTSRCAGIGYCTGGAMVLELARAGADLKAVVGFHPSLSTTRPQDAANIVGKVLVCVGSEDPFITAEQRLGSSRRCGPPASTGGSTFTAEPSTAAPIHASTPTSASYQAGATSELSHFFDA